MAERARAGADPPPFDPQRCFVRLTQVRADGFVEFEFAIGEPDLAVELILPADAYREFCRHNGAIELTPVETAEVDRARTLDRARTRGLAPDDSG